MTTYSLKLNNKFMDGKFYFFTDVPKAGGTLFTNTWLAAAIPKGGYEKIQTTTNYFAWCGASPISDPGSGTVISGGQTVPVTLGVQGGVAGATYKTKNLMNETLEFLPEVPSGAPGAYCIIDSTDFTVSHNYMIGMALADPVDTGSIVPVATMLAVPGLTNQISPVVRFYVAFGDAEQGEIIDFTSVSTTAGSFDFSPHSAGEGCLYGEITIGPDGIFSPCSYKPKAPHDFYHDTDTWVELIIAFTPILKTAFASAIAAYLTNQLSSANLVNLRWSGLGIKLNLKFQRNSQYSTTQDLISLVNKDLAAAVSAGILPRGESFVVSQSYNTEMAKKHHLALSNRSKVKDCDKE